MIPALVIVGVVALIVLGAWIAYQQKKKRRLALQAFAKQNGMQFDRSDPFGLLSLGFRLFTLGDGRGTENVMWGEWKGIPVREADYWYYEETTDSEGRRSRSYYHFSVVVAQMPVVVPAVTVERENVFTRLADHLGFHDIDFESEDFNRRFQVKSHDKEFAYKLLDGRMIQWLLSTGAEFGFEVNGPYLLTYHKRLKPAQLVPLFGTSEAFVGHIPRLVRLEFAAPGATPALAGPDVAEPPQPPAPGRPDQAAQP